MIHGSKSGLRVSAGSGVIAMTDREDVVVFEGIDVVADAISVAGIGDRLATRGTDKGRDGGRQPLKEPWPLRGSIGFLVDAQVVQRLHLQVGQNVVEPTAGLPLVEAAGRLAGPEIPPAGGKVLQATCPDPSRR